MTTRGRESMRTRLCSHRAMLTRIILGNYLRRVSTGSWWGSPCTCRMFPYRAAERITWSMWPHSMTRSEEHTSELQSRLHLVCRLLLEKKKKKEQVQLNNT